MPQTSMTRKSSMEAVAGPSSQPASPRNSTKHCEFCILAEFDIDRGSTLAHQYPGPTGYDDHMLAELMLPDGAHARSEDWTFFFLKPATFLRQVDDTHTDPSAWTSDDLTYVISLVRTRHDSSVRRGALVKALAIGTRHPFIDIFKPALLMALDDYFNEPGEQCLANLYNAINDLDLSMAPIFSKAEKQVLRASDRRDLLEERFAHVERSSAYTNQSYIDLNTTSRDSEIARARPESVSTLASVTRSHLSPEPKSTKARDSSGSSVLAATTILGDLRTAPVSPKPRDTHFYDTILHYRTFQLPLRVPLTTFAEEVGEYSLIKLIQTFSSPQSTPTGPLHPHLHTNGASTHPIILLFNALVTQKRIIFLGYGQPASHVASFVLAACALGSGCGSLLKGFAARAFPYTNLLNLDDLEKVPGYIAGVTNPRFEDLHAWDVLLNVGTGKIQVAKDIATSSPATPAASKNKASTLPRDGLSSNSLASVAGSSGIGHDARAGHNTDLGQFGALPMSGFVGKSSSLAGAVGALGDARERLTASDGKMDVVSPLFMEELQAAIAAHYGERFVRCRVTEFVFAFVRGVARHEEHFYGHTTLGPSCQPFLNGQLGSGPAYLDRDSEMRDILANQMRVEGFRGSIAHQLLARDLQESDGYTEAIKNFDVTHQIGRLRKAKSLAAGESDLIFETIAKTVLTQEQLTELLALLPAHNGGLMPLGLGLFHPNLKIRDLVVDFFLRLCRHSLGRKFVQSMNTYQRLAFARMAQERAEQRQVESSTDSALSNSKVSRADSTATRRSDQPKISRPNSNVLVGNERPLSGLMRS